MRVVFSESCPNASLMTGALGDAGPTVPAHIERELDGTSCHPADFLQLAVHSVRGVQVYYSLLNRDFEWELMPLGIDQQVGSIIWSPLAAGRLGGCYRPCRKTEEWHAEAHP